MEQMIWIISRGHNPFGSGIISREGLRMTLQELYQEIGGDYDQAMKVLRMEKLLDKHIRRFSANGVVEALLEAGKSMDPTEMFERAHAMKGVCGNLGLVSMAELASSIAEEFRPGNSRTMTDEALKDKLQSISDQYLRAKEGIKRYEEA